MKRKLFVLTYVILICAFFGSGALNSVYAVPCGTETCPSGQVVQRYCDVCPPVPGTSCHTDTCSPYCNCNDSGAWCYQCAGSSPNPACGTLECRAGGDCWTNTDSCNPPCPPSCSAPYCGQGDGCGGSCNDNRHGCVDHPINGTEYSATDDIHIAGWALDVNASQGTGVSGIHLYVDGEYFMTPLYGVSRPDVAAAHCGGAVKCIPSGFDQYINLPFGHHELKFYAIKDATQTTCANWLIGTRNVMVTNTPPQIISVTPVDLTCGSSWSGIEGNNPLSVEVRVNDPDGDSANEIRRVWLALAPDEADDRGDAGCGSWENDLRGYFGALYDVQGEWRSVAADAPSYPPCPWGGANTRFTLENVGHRSDGDDLIVTFEIKFEEDFPEGEYKFFVMADDVHHASTCPEGGYCWTEFDDWGVDQTPPTINSSTKTVGAERIEIKWGVTDSLSGVNSTSYGGSDSFCPAQSWLRPNGCLLDITLDAQNFATDVILVIPQLFEDLTEAERNALKLTRSVQDNACNVREEDTSLAEMGTSWMYTTTGDVYSKSGANIQTPGTSEYFGTYVCLRHDVGGGSYLFTGGSGVSRQGDDWNLTSSRMEDVIEDEIDTLILAVRDAAELTEHKLGGMNIVETEVITGVSNNTIYYSSSDLRVNPQFLNDKNVVAVFIAAQDIIIQEGEDLSQGTGVNDYAEEQIYGAFIAGGAFKTSYDPGVADSAADWLYVKGLVVSKGQLQVSRNLGYAANTEQASEVFEYDPRYLMIFREAFGGIGPVQFFESGVK